MPCEVMEPVDQHARYQALDPAGSFIIQAPAGSGKTGLLIRRFLRLLTTVTSPEQILAITFTRKATTEMRLRILNALKGRDMHGQTETDAELIQLAQAALEHDRKQGWDLAQNPRRLRVQTIDSFCNELVSRMPWSARFGTVPSPLEDASQLYLHAADATLGMIEDIDRPDLAQACARVLGLVNADRHYAQALLADLLAQRDRWMNNLASHSREQFEVWWHETVNSTLAECNALLDDNWRNQLADSASHAAVLVQDPDNNASDETIKSLSGWVDSHDFPRPTVDELHRWQGLAHLLLTTRGRPRRRITKKDGFPVTSDHCDTAPNDVDAGRNKTISNAQLVEAKKRFIELLNKLQDMNDHILAWKRVSSLPEPTISDAHWETLQALLVVLPTAVAQLRVLFAEKHQADFTEIAQRADWALGEIDNPSDLTLTLDYQLRHVLLDEFQDTSISQLELLKKLLAGWECGDGRTLFFVGDPMQSIYRFRDAEIRIFLDVQDQGFVDIQPTPLTLESNFRSAPALVEWFNTAFPTVMPNKRSIVHGAVNYTEASAYLPADADSGVHIHASPKRDNTAEANKVAALIAMTLERYPEQEIAVLGRTRGHLSHIMRTLKKRGIPYQGIKLERLAERAAVQDLMALALALSQPADQTAWLCLLRAPWCGATLSDLVHLVGESGRTPVFEALHDSKHLTKLTADSRNRLSRVRDVMSDGLFDFHRFPLCRILESCWLRLGGPVVVSPEDLANCRRFIDLVRTLETEGMPIHSQSLTEAMNGLYAENHTEQLVKLITIHGAKGLEFSTVILVGLDRSTRGDKSELIRWRRFPNRLLAATKPRRHETNAFYDYLGRLEQEHQEYERGRLLYVACTRARHRLHLFGSVTLKNSHSAPAKTSLLSLLWPVVKECWLSRHQPDDSRTPETQDDLDPQETTLYQLDSEWKLPSLPESIDPMAEVMEFVEEDEPIDFDWTKETTRITGIVIHQALQEVDRHGWKSWKNREFCAIDRDTWRRQLMDRKLPKSKLDEALKRLETTLVQVQKDPLADWIFSPNHTEIHAEWALTGVHKGEIRHVVLDRCFVDEQGVRWIVDFKSSRHEDRNTLESFLEDEKERYRLAMSRYAAIVSALEGRPPQAALYYPVFGTLIKYEAQSLLLR